MLVNETIRGDVMEYILTSFEFEKDAVALSQYLISDLSVINRLEVGLDGRYYLYVDTTYDRMALFESIVQYLAFFLRGTSYVV